MADTNGKNGNGKMSGDMNQGTCQHGMCGCGGYGANHRCGFGWGLLRVIVALIVLGLVFCFGVMVGTLRGLIVSYSNGGRPMMRSSYSNGMGNQYPMMGVPTSTSANQ